MKPLLLALLLLFVSPSIAQQDKLIRQYDRFEDRTRYWTSPLIVQRNLDLMAYFSFQGKGAGHNVDSLGLIFSSTASDWRYLKDSRLLCLLDGKPLDLGSPSAKDSDVKNGYSGVEVKEVLMFSVGYQTLERIAQAKVVEMRLGTTELYLDSRLQGRIKALLEKVKVVK